jgi:hypothetical protein
MAGKEMETVSKERVEVMISIARQQRQKTSRCGSILGCVLAIFRA